MLSSPICADHHLETLLGEFIRMHHQPCFVQIYQREAELLRDVFHHYVVQNWVWNFGWMARPGPPEGGKKTHTPEEVAQYGQKCRRDRKPDRCGRATGRCSESATNGARVEEMMGTSDFL